MSALVEIRLLDRGGRELRVQQLAGPVVQLGRSPDSDVAFDPDLERTVSGRHAELRIDGDVLSVVDVGSRNGTFVNGERLRGARPLQPGDRVRLGDGGPEFTAVLVEDNATIPMVGTMATRVGPSSGQTSGRSSDPSSDRARPVDNAVELGTASSVVPAGRAIGEQTLRRVLNQVVRRERRRTLVVSVAVVALAAVGWAVLGSSSDRGGGAAPTAADGARDGPVHGAGDGAGVGDAAGDGPSGTTGTVADPADVSAPTPIPSGDVPPADTGAERPLPPPEAEEWSVLLQRIAPSVYLVVRSGTVEGEHVEQAFGTAWVVAPGTLATNAHIARIHESSTSIVLRSNATEPRDLAVETVELHPGYGEFVELLRRYRPFDANTGRFLNLEPAFDVALLRVRGAPDLLAPALPLADATVLDRLVAGQQVASIGYPKEGMQGGGTDVHRPAATTDIKPLTRLSDVFFSKARTADEALNLTYGFVAVGGSSGSPVLDRAGRVVGLIASGNVLTDGERGRIAIDGSCHGPRADLVQELLDGTAADRQRQRSGALEREFRQRFLAGTATPRLFARSVVRLQRPGGRRPENVQPEIVAEVDGEVAPGGSVGLGPLRVDAAGSHRVVLLCRDHPARPSVRLRQAEGPWSREQPAEHYWWVSAPLELQPERQLELEVRLDAEAAPSPVRVTALILREP